MKFFKWLLTLFMILRPEQWSVLSNGVKFDVVSAKGGLMGQLIWAQFSYTYRASRYSGLRRFDMKISKNIISGVTNVVIDGQAVGDAAVIIKKKLITLRKQKAVVIIVMANGITYKITGDPSVPLLADEKALAAV